MRRRLLAFIASAVLLPAIAAGSAAADDPSVQAVGQSAGSQQSATSSASSTQVQPSNTNVSVRIGSPGEGGAVTQDNSSTALSAAGNKNDTTQQAGQSAGGSGVQNADQSAYNKQSADSSATSTQVKPSNTNISVRIGSPGDDGSVTQTNSSKAASVAGNKNSTSQTAGQSGGGSGGTQNVDQSAGNKQDAHSDATSEQDHAKNVNIPVRIFSDGNDGSVTQTNSSDAKSAAGNKNETTQQSEQDSGSQKSAPVRDACGGGCGGHDGSSVQDVEQKAYNDQSAHSSATSEQDHPSNVNIPVRIHSPGNDGDVTQTNSSDAKSAAGNKNATEQVAEQSAGGSGSGSVQHIGQKAGSKQDADSDATSHQFGASNSNTPVRIGSPGGGGSVDQSNSSDAKSAAGNLNGTSQGASQNAGSAPDMLRVKDECGDKCGEPKDGCREKCDGHGGPVVQDVDQKAYNDQSAKSSADSTQCCASNTNAPVRIKSKGDDGEVTQSNSSDAKSAAGNVNGTEQTADQSAGGSGGETVQAIGQWADNWQGASSHATSEQSGASNANSPVRIKSEGDDGDVTQSNSSSALSVAGNKNDTTQNASQNAGGHSAPAVRDAGCGSCGGDDPTVQAIGQWSTSGQKAESSADSTQDGACNTNEPVRIKSAGDDGKVRQSNSSFAASAAGNKNDTDQSADQSAGGRGIAVQAVGQWADNWQGAKSDASSKQYAPSNSNAPVRLYSKGGGGSVDQSNASAALSAAGNRNSTCQLAFQGSDPRCEKKVREPVDMKQVD